MTAYIVDTQNGSIVRTLSSIGHARRSLGIMFRKEAGKRNPSPTINRLKAVTEQEWLTTWKPWGDELVDTVNILSGKPLKIARRDRGTCVDPGTERYHAM